MEKRVLYPRYKSTFHKLGKNQILPELSPREQRFYIENPSLIRKNRKFSPQVQVYQELIERSLSNARGNHIRMKILDRDYEKDNNKFSFNLKKSMKTEDSKHSFLRDISINKHMRNIRMKLKMPKLEDCSLKILKYSPKHYLLTNKVEPTEVSPEMSSESDEFRMESNLALDYI